MKVVPIVVVGPSGVGKGTLIKEMNRLHPNAFSFSVSHTTRNPRPGEVDGVDYVFEKKEDMEKMIAEGKFIEHANVHGHLYGTSYEGVEKVMKAGKICIIEIDVQGAQQLHDKNFDAKFFFIDPPSAEELRRRLVGRGTEDAKTVEMRLENSKRELSVGQKSEFFVHVVNDEVTRAAEELLGHIKDEVAFVEASSPLPKS